jgi:arsenate reductase
MNDDIRIFHNPRCSKSRQTMDILKNQGLNVAIVEYLKTPPSHAELEEVLDLLGIQPRELMRKNEQTYKEYGLDNPALTRQQLIQAMIDNPVLIERPIVISGNKAVIGRPPEKVLEILS